jgi:hypothetical protein
VSPGTVSLLKTAEATQELDIPEQESSHPAVWIQTFCAMKKAALTGINRKKG